LKILLAEDSVTNQKLAVALLERRGHQVTVVGNGKLAVAALSEAPFDVVLMDVQMPEMDGLEATAAIRSHEKKTGQHIPIVAMTAHAMKGDRERCLEAGMDGYVAKPIHPHELFAAVEMHAGDDSRHREPRQGALATPVSPTEIDWTKALAAVGGDRKLLAEIVRIFLDEVPRLRSEIREAIEAHDGARLRRAAHTLKGSLRIFGESKSYELAETLETMGKENQTRRATIPLHQFNQLLDAFIVQLGPVAQGTREPFP
jgi:CheY-like chemotaxis protein